MLITLLHEQGGFWGPKSLTGILKVEDATLASILLEDEALKK